MIICVKESKFISCYLLIANLQVFAVIYIQNENDLAASELSTK